MANDFTKDTACVALWRFETGALTADSIGANTLTAVNTPTADADHQEGSYSTLLVNATHHYYEITDANLASGFPFKSTETNRIFSMGLFFKAVTLSGVRFIVGKDNNSGTRSWSIYANGTNLYFSNNANSQLLGIIATGKWYFLGISWDGTSKLSYYLYNVTDSTPMVATTATVLGGATPINNIAFRIGAYANQNTTLTWDGYIDEVSMFNRALNIHELEMLRIQAFHGAYSIISGKLFVDPINGVDGNSGRAWATISYTGGTGSQPVAAETATGATSGKTAKVYDHSGTWGQQGYLRILIPSGAFTPGETLNFTNGGSCTLVNACISAIKSPNRYSDAGDIFYISKTPETAGSGTVTATVGSVTINTTADLSAFLPAGSHFRIERVNEVYLVKSITSSAITLYRPYRGPSGGSGLTIYKIAYSADATSGGWKGVGTGVAANYITWKGGINPQDLTQDGFTMVKAASTSNVGLNGTLNYYDLSRLGMVGFAKCFAEIANYCKYNNLYFSCQGAPVSGGWYYPVELNGIVIEGASSGCGIPNIYNGDVNNLETTGGLNTLELWNVNFYGFKACPQTGQSCLSPGQNIWSNVHFWNPVLYEGTAAGTFAANMGWGNAPAIMKNVIFHNPTVNPSNAITSLCNGVMNGEVSFNEINGDPVKHITFISTQASAGDNLVTVSFETTVVHVAAQSVKVQLAGLSSPYVWKGLVPCEAGVAKTISVWMRKNSAYGSLTRPTMRLRWLTGTGANAVYNIHEETMSDSVDTWEQLSYQVTPSMKGVIIVELVFKSLYTGTTPFPIAYFAEFGVS